MNIRRVLEVWFPIIHRYLLLLGGLLGVGYETVVDHADRPELLGLYGAMLGLAEVIYHWTGRADASSTETNKDSQQKREKDAS